MNPFEERLRDAIHNAMARDRDGLPRYVNSWQVNAVFAAVLAELANHAPILALPDDIDLSDVESALKSAQSRPMFLVNLPAPTFHRVAPKAMPDGSIVVQLPPDGALVRHRHVWDQRAEPGRFRSTYRCGFQYLDGSMCDAIWATYGGAQLPDWGERWFISGPYVERPDADAWAPRDLFDLIELSAADYRYKHRIPHGDSLIVAVKTGMAGLSAAAGARGMPTVTDAAILTWLAVRNLSLVEIHDVWAPEGGTDVLVYKPGTWVTAGSPPGYAGRVRLPHGTVAKAISVAPKRLEGEGWTVTVGGLPGEHELIVTHAHCWRPSMEDGQRCLWVDPDGERCGAPNTLTTGSARAVWWSLPRTIPVSALVDDTPAKDERPHSRACGIGPHEHGQACSVDCPTCHPLRTEES